MWCQAVADPFAEERRWRYRRLPLTAKSTGKSFWRSYRVFVDVDEDSDEIVVFEARLREHLYR